MKINSPFSVNASHSLSLRKNCCNLTIDLYPVSDMKTNDSYARSIDHISPRSVILHDFDSMSTPIRTSSPLRTRSLRLTSYTPRSHYDDSENSLLHSIHTKTDSNHSQKCIPFVSKLTLNQALPLIFSAFWDGANLYADVLGIDPSKRETLSTARLRLAYFRKGREVLASPVEVDDEITTLTYQGFSASGVATHSTKMAIRSGVPISRKAKKRFQAICLAYEVLSDPQTRNQYDVWWKQQDRQRQTPLSAQKGFGRKSTRLDTIIEKINSVPVRKGAGRSSYLAKRLEREDSSFHSFSDSRADSSFIDFSGDVLITDDPDLSRSFSTTSSGLDSILRPTTVSRSRRSMTPTKIRWNEQVEELVIMDYDAKHEHSTQSYDHIKKTGTHRSPDIESFDNDDVWSSSHPFFPEHDVDMPFDESGCYFPSKKIDTRYKSNRKSNRKSSKAAHLDKGNRMESEYDDEDESNSYDDTESSSHFRQSVSGKGTRYEKECRSARDFEDDGDCGVPLAFDLAAGFQVALSKYLGSVLSEMKSGLSELGKTFSDIDVNHSQMHTHDKQCGNEFFMDDFEVNALMSVLRSEMNQHPVQS